MIDPDDLAAFHAAVGDSRPLPDSGRVDLTGKPPAPRPLQHLARQHSAQDENRHGPMALHDRLEGGDEASYLRNDLAQSVLRDLRRARWVIHDEIDLHGLNRDEARHLLSVFLFECLHTGKRCVRVIHGKGLNLPGRQSILRQLVRGWLMQRNEILAYCPSRPQDGGEGALMVLLQAPKKTRAT